MEHEEDSIGGADGQGGLTDGRELAGLVVS